MILQASHRSVNASSDQHRVSFVIPADHPALPGHFPGRPVVPGVMMLGRVLDAAERWIGRMPAALALPQVKFLQPLLPGQRAEIELERHDARLRFRVLRADTLLASGELIFDDVT